MEIITTVIGIIAVDDPFNYAASLLWIKLGFGVL